MSIPDLVPVVADAVAAMLVRQQNSARWCPPVLGCVWTIVMEYHDDVFESLLRLVAGARAIVPCFQCWERGGLEMVWTPALLLRPDLSLCAQAHLELFHGKGPRVECFARVTGSRKSMRTNPIHEALNVVAVRSGMTPWPEKRRKVQVSKLRRFLAST
jgi:hypothetical protein